jgi:hypothetical protein
MLTAFFFGSFVGYILHTIALFMHVIGMDALALLLIREYTEFVFNAVS